MRRPSPTHSASRISYRNAELLVDLKLDREAVAIPSEPPLDVEPLLVPVAGHNVLDGARQQVTVVRQTRRERRAVVERVPRAAFALLQRRLKGVNLLPELERLLLLLREGDALRN